MITFLKDFIEILRGCDVSIRIVVLRDNWSTLLVGSLRDIRHIRLMADEVSFAF